MKSPDGKPMTIGISVDGGQVVAYACNGTDDLTMNGVTYVFTAAPVSGEAGIYTADLNGVRATWVVREDGSAVGVQLNGISATLDQADIIQLNDAGDRFVPLALTTRSPAGAVFPSSRIKTFRPRRAVRSVKSP